MSTHVTPIPSRPGERQEPALFGSFQSGSYPHQVGGIQRAERGRYPHPGAGRAGRARALPPPIPTPPEELDQMIQLVEEGSDSIEEIASDELREETTPEPELELSSDDALDLGSFEDCEATPAPAPVEPASSEELGAKPLVSVPLPPLPTVRNSPPPMPDALPPRLALTTDQLAAKLLQPSASAGLPPPIPASGRRARATLPPPFSAGPRPTEEAVDTPTPQRLITERDIDLTSLPEPLPVVQPPVAEAGGPVRVIAPSELIIAPELAEESDDDTIPVIGHEGARLDDSWFESKAWEEKDQGREGTELVDSTITPQRAADHRRRLFAGSLVGVAVAAFAFGALLTSRGNQGAASATAAEQAVPAQPAQTTEIPQPVAVPLAATKPPPTQTATEVAPVVTPIEEQAKPVDPATLEALDMLAPEASPEQPVVASAGDGQEQETAADEPESADDEAVEARMPPRKAEVQKQKEQRHKSSRKARTARREHKRSRSKRHTRVATASSGKRGTLMVGAKPPCRLYVDGKYVGTTPQRAVRLPAGSHRVVLRNKEHRISKQLTVNIKAGKRTRVIRDYM